MAKSAKSDRTQFSKAPKARFKQRSGWFKLILIPYAFVLYKLMGLFDLRNLDFLKRVMDYWGRGDYILNFVCAAASVLGLLLLIIGPTRYRFVTALGLLMFLTPVWLQGNPSTITAVREAYALKMSWNTKVILFEVSTAFWAVLLVRGDPKTEWVKLIAAVILMALQAVIYLSGADLFIAWELYIKILPLSLLTGFVLDLLLGGFSLQSLLPALVVFLTVALDLFLPEKTSAANLYKLILWTALILSAISFIVLLVKRPIKNSSLGGLCVLFYIMISALMFIIFLLGRRELPALIKFF